MKHLTTMPIAWESLAALKHATQEPSSGALVVFVGIVRPDQEGARSVIALSYEAYTQMCESVIDRLISEARFHWELDSVRIQHRLGLLEAGQISLVVVVAAQHRAAAYAASQFLIEGIKRDVPIWKREHYDDGSSQWISPASSRAEQDCHAHV